jgi:hypothetical protein
MFPAEQQKRMRFWSFVKDEANKFARIHYQTRTANPTTSEVVGRSATPHRERIPTSRSLFERWPDSARQSTPRQPVHGESLDHEHFQTVPPW